ncbi:hypothetical protein D3C79_691720 [compost metagenome]
MGQPHRLHQVGDKAQAAGVAHIAHAPAQLTLDSVDDGLDLLAFTVVADQYFQRLIGLAKGAVQGHGKEPRAVGGDDDTDERLFVHVGDLAKKSAPHLTVATHDWLRMQRYQM